MSAEDEGFKAALEEARKGVKEGGVPIGACLVDKDGKILGRGHNMRVQKGSAILHVRSLSIFTMSLSKHCSHTFNFVVLTIHRARCRPSNQQVDSRLPLTRAQRCTPHSHPVTCAPEPVFCTKYLALYSARTRPSSAARSISANTALRSSTSKAQSARN